MLLCSRRWDNGRVRTTLLDHRRWRRVGASVIAALVAVTGWAGDPPDPPDPLPWEIWRDLGEIARLRLDHQVVMRSSRCPDGCAYDRHSDGDSRFIRTIGDEGVIFESEGAGAITRIWMTQGDGGISQSPCKSTSCSTA